MRSQNKADWSFEDLTSYVIEELFNALITGGTTGMKQRFYVVYCVICDWQETWVKKKNEKS